MAYGQVNAVSQIALPVQVKDGGTGATTAEKAIGNLGAVPTSRTINGRALDKNINLTVDDIGVYELAADLKNLYVKDNDVRIVRYNSATLNTPYKDGLDNANSGVCIFSCTSETYQTLTVFPTSNEKIFSKSRGGSGWNESWSTVYTTKNKPTAADIGAATSSHTHSYLPLSGGTLTGDLKFKSGSYTAEPIRLEPGDANGAALIIQAGGLTIVGGGESASNLFSALGLTAGTEQLHLGSDNGIYLHVNCQTIANRKTVTIDAAGKITAPGGFGGKADSATKLATKRTIAISGGATGTATGFDGSANISIPVTKLDMSKASGTIPAAVKATNSTDYTTSRIRNIRASTTDLTPKSSALSNGEVYLVYE